MTRRLKSASSGQPVPVRAKIGEAARQFGFLWKERGPGKKLDFSRLEIEFQEYSDLARRYGNFELTSARVFEIGCGQRPHRLFYLIANQVNAYAIDMDKVMMSPNLAEIALTFGKNGLERTVKTVLRRVLFDGAEQKQLRAFLSARAGQPFEWPLDRISHGSAADPNAWPDGKFDFVLSEDVFEHIPADQLHVVCAQIADRLNERGIALIRPMVFTGIRGGHHVDWYNTSVDSVRKCPPWDHLRENLHPANTYLNKLHLAGYRRIFVRHFDIVAEAVKSPWVGKDFLTDQIRQELAPYSEEELFSNHVAFVLRRKK
ncbi:MAG: class I SAM-dependent methyltransferase [Hyphomicrobium sp.]